jgi:hypothetical protein
VSFDEKLEVSDLVNWLEDVEIMGQNIAVIALDVINTIEGAARAQARAQAQAQRGRSEGAGPAPLQDLRFTDWISQRVHTAIVRDICPLWLTNYPIFPNPEIFAKAS